MKVRIVEPVAGHADERYGLEDFSFRPGEEIELNDELAAAWIESGRAAAVEAPAEDEPAVTHHHEQHHDKVKKMPARAGR